MKTLNLIPPVQHMATNPLEIITAVFSSFFPLFSLLPIKEHLLHFYFSPQLAYTKSSISKNINTDVPHPIVGVIRGVVIIHPALQFLSIFIFTSTWLEITATEI